MSAEHTSLLIADDHPVVAEGLARILAERFDVLDVVNNLDAVEDAVRNLRPDLVLLDLSFGAQSALPVLRRLAHDDPSIRVIMLTAHDDPVLADAAIAAGARGYVVKQGSSDELYEAIDAVMSGGTFLSASVRARGAGAAPLPRRASAALLTPRQLEVLALVRQGNSSTDIGQQLGIASKTVDRHVEDMCTTLGIRKRSQLVRWAERHFGDETARG